MDAELFGPLLHQLFEGGSHLLFSHAVFGFAGVVHNVVAHAEHAARIVAAEHGFRHTGHPIQKFHMGVVVQVDVSTHLAGLFHVLHRGHV